MSEQQIVWADEVVEEPVQVETPTPAAPAPDGALPEPKKEKPIPVFAVPEPTTGGIPAWAIWPDGLQAPRGRAVYFARFPSNWTDTPSKGVEQGLTDEEKLAWSLNGVALPKAWRQAVFWALSLGDQKIALGRANGDQNRFNSELAKQMIRGIDGVMVDRSGVSGQGNLDIWWEQLGERCRSELTRMCTRIHSLSVQERALFFGHCVASRAAG